MVVPQKINQNYHMIQQFHFRVYPKEFNEGLKDIFVLFTAALFKIAKRWKPPKYPLTDEWINKMWYIHTMKYYSALKKEILTCAIIWMNLWDILLIEIS